MTLAELIQTLTLPNGTTLPSGNITVQQLADLLNDGGQDANTVTISLQTPAKVGTAPFGAKLRTLRLQKQWTQKKLGDEAGGMHMLTIRQYESGRRTPDLDSVQRLATALNVKVEDLLQTDE